MPSTLCDYGYARAENASGIIKVFFLITICKTLNLKLCSENVFKLNLCSENRVKPYENILRKNKFFSRFSWIVFFPLKFEWQHVK